MCPRPPSRKRLRKILRQHTDQRQECQEPGTPPAGSGAFSIRSLVLDMMNIWLPRRLIAERTSPRADPLLRPSGASRKDRRAELHLARPRVPVLDRVDPSEIVRRLQVGVERRLVAVDFVEIQGVRILCVLEHVEPVTTGLVVYRAASIVEHRNEKRLAMVGLNPERRN